MRVALAAVDLAHFDTFLERARDDVACKPGCSRAYAPHKFLAGVDFWSSIPPFLVGGIASVHLKIFSQVSPCLSFRSLT